MTTPPDTQVLVMGAGSIGCWLGGRLAAAGVPVALVGRPRMLDTLRRDGLHLTDGDGGGLHLRPDQLRLYTQLPAGLAPSLVLLCVKSGATAEAAAELGRLLPPGTPVVSMQNGVRNPEVAQHAAPRLAVLAGMVPYNVAEVGPGHLHRGTPGALAIQRHPALLPWVPIFAAAGLPLTLEDDMPAVQWGKLLLNLNNAVNALSGLPLRQQLLDRSLRGCTAALVDEAAAVLERAHIRLRMPAGLVPHRLAWLMRLPTPVFRLLAARQLRVDAQARSSMADDLLLGRPTEVDVIQGEVVRLAEEHGVAAPLNERIVHLVRQWPRHPERMSGDALREALGL